jgi:hypothetical protein
VSNYRGELLGGQMVALILKVASSLLLGNEHPAVVACDNMGVVIHGNGCHRSLREAQSQADLIRCFRGILAELPFKIIYEQVYGHQDKNLPWSVLTLLQQLNTIADQLAKDALWQVYFVQFPIRELSYHHQWPQSHILDSRGPVSAMGL